MILTDAGPLVALALTRDPEHRRCVQTLANLPPPLVTTWPVFTEAMYLIGRQLGWYGQAALWRLVERGILQLADISVAATSRMQELMELYHDLPMDLADASLVAIAEERRLDRIFTLDSDFRVYRLPRGRSFTIIP
ncbi:MAG TPA: PIN domain-containing protein [Chloroflexota bacterium]|nr:PIN domain-containing protein [Chloroflexota bacterium]